MLHWHILPTQLLNDVCMATTDLWATLYSRYPCAASSLEKEKGGSWISLWTLSLTCLSSTYWDRTNRQRDKASETVIHFSALHGLDLVCLTRWWGWCARAFRRGDIPESLQGHCLLLYITLHPSGHLWEGEDSRTHPAKCERLQNTRSWLQGADTWYIING